MRREFKQVLFNSMLKDDNIWLISPDLGFKFLDEIRDSFKDRVIIMGASEQCAIGTACGLALSGYIPIVYSITPFIVSRGHEWLKNYLNHDKIPVKLLTSGRDDDYSKEAGFSHDGFCDKGIMREFPNIISYWPDKIEELEEVTDNWLYNNSASYLNLKR